MCLAPFDPSKTGPAHRENRPNFAFSGETLWTIPVGNLWIKKVIESCFLCCACWAVSISIASEVRGTSIRERVRIVETERALQQASHRGRKFTGRAGWAAPGRLARQGEALGTAAKKALV